LPWSFVEGPPEAIAERSSRLLESFSDRGGFILSSGCEIPPEARPEAIDAMVASTRGGR
jgi:uroporphyrinogen decarboxylase